MSTRASRRTHLGGIDATSTNLNNTESLILAQAVWDYGANSWPAVAKVLTKHPLISRPKSYFTAQSCHIMYDNLMKEAGFERTEANNVVHAPINQRLAEKQFTARFEELRGLILAEETKFKILVAEIEDIRSGRRDEEIKTSITGAPEPEVSYGDTMTELEAPAKLSLQEEVFDGSDLSPPTDTPTSQPPLQDDDEQVGTAHIRYAEPVQREPYPINAAQCLEDNEEPSSSIRTASPARLDTGIGTTASSEEDEVQDIVDQHQSSPPANPETSNQFTDDKKVEEEMDKEVALAEEEEEEEEEEAGNTDATVETKEREETITEGGSVQEEGPLIGHIEGSGEGEQTTWEPASDLEQKAVAASELEQITTQPLEPQSETGRNVGYEEKKSTEIGKETGGDTDAEKPAEDDAISSGDEPLQATRRSTRRRSSAQPPPMRVAKSRRQKRIPTDPAGSPEEMDLDSTHELNDPEAKSEEEESSSRRQEAKRKASVVEIAESPREKKRARDDSEPVDDDEPGPSSITRGRRRGDRDEQVASKRFQSVLTMLHSQISQHRNGNIFHNPIKNSEAPDYHEIVKRPIDLKTIKMKIKDGGISTSPEFHRDIFLMFANAMMYNRPGSDVHIMAEDMMVESEVQIESFRQTEGLVRGGHRI